MKAIHFLCLLITLSHTFLLLLWLCYCYHRLPLSGCQTACSLTALAERPDLMPTSALTTYQSQYFKFYVGRSWVGGCVLHEVNIHQEATYVCIGDHQLRNNSVLPSLSPVRLPCDKAEMEVCCRSEWGCNYFLTSLSASKPSHSALQLMRCPCGIVMLSKWMPLWQPRA